MVCQSTAAAPLLLQEYRVACDIATKKTPPLQPQKFATSSVTIVRPRRGVAGRTAVARKNVRVRVISALAMWYLSAMTAMAAVFMLLPTHREGAISRTRQDYWDEFIRPLLEDKSFKMRFRMEPKEFDKLYEMLRTRLEGDERKGRGRNGTIAGEWVLASTLQWLAGHGVCAGADGPRMARSTAYAKIQRGLDAINDCGRLRIRWARTEEELQKNAQGYRARSSQRDPPLKHCVGALDGVLIRRSKPSRKEHPCPDRFFSGHKMTVGMNYQTRLCGRLQFLNASHRLPSSYILRIL